MTAATLCLALYQMRDNAAASLSAAGLASHATRLAALPQLTDPGAPVKWLTAHLWAATAADDKRNFATGTKCQMVVGALAGLLDDLLQERVEREADEARAARRAG